MKCLVVSPHPDDETLGAGGTLHRLGAEGDELYWLIVTHVNTEFGASREQIATRERQLETVAESYGFREVYNLKLTPASLSSLPEGMLIDGIRKFFQHAHPDWVFLPDPHDAHSDHRMTFEAAMAVLKKFRAPYISRIMTMEILSETNFGNAFAHFEPNFYVDISGQLDRKLSTLKMFAGEIAEHPFPRSLEAVKALATLRGTETGTRSAEAFHIVKEFM